MTQRNRDIAIIGIACRYPGAQDVRSFWENILASRRQFRRMPDCRLPLSDYWDKKATDKTYATQAAVMELPKFDWAAHRIPKSSYEGTDAVHWLAYQVAIDAVKDAGYTRESMPRRKSGVLLGNTLCGEETRSLGIRLRWPFLARSIREASRRAGVSERAAEQLVAEAESVVKSVFPALSEDSLAGAMSNTIAGRICSYFDLDGGGYVVDGAGASSLLAVAMAAGKLETGDLDLVVVGGVDLSIDPLEMVGYAGAGALTPNGMSVFDRRASGFILGEGCGMAVLKRLEDAERDGNFIYAVIKGCGISSDGRGALNEPNALGQSKAILRAHAQAGYSPRTLDFIEGYGSGTPAGDRAELEAVHLALRGAPAEHAASCGMTALKSIIGHAKGAAGIGSLIKAVVALNRRVLPPLAGCALPHPFFEVTGPSLYPLVRGEVRAPDATLRAGVSAMGMGGINCHITLESRDPPRPEVSPTLSERTLLFSAQETEVFLFSAATKEELAQKLAEVRPDAEAASLAELTDLAAELARAAERGAGPHRAAIVAHAPEVLVSGIDRALQMIAETEGDVLDQATLDRRILIRTAEAPARVALVFPDARAEALEIGRVLVERHDWARALVNEADAALSRRGAPSLSSLLFSERPALDDAELERRQTALEDSGLSVPAVCLTSMLWARYMVKLGLEPTVVTGFGIGERTAGTADGELEGLFEAALAEGARDEAVDVLGLVDKLAESCDLLLEVGGAPGLSRRVLEILGPDGVSNHPSAATPCLPLESYAGNDRDLSCALGALFTHGVNLAWSRAFEGRHVVPFVSPRARNFFRNPCERPFPPPVRKEGHATPAIVEIPGSDGLGLPANYLQRYLERHGDLVTEMIRADLKRLAKASEIELPETFVAQPAPPEKNVASDAAVEGPGAVASAATKAEGDGDIAGKIIELICEKTGYPESSISMDSRLLDDLNLDSIKAAEIVGTTAQAFGAGGQIDASMFANANIQEIAGAIRLARMNEGQAIDVTAHDGSVRVLNLGELSDPPWVRNFACGMLEEVELPADTDGAQREEEDWKSAVVLILADEEDANPYARALTRALVELGAIVSVWPYSAQDALERGKFSHTFALLPHTAEPGVEALERSVRRLHAAATVSSGPNRLPRKKVNALIFLQFQEGCFAGPARTEPFEDGGVVSFAASVHLERSRQRVRVIDAARSLAPEAVASAMIREIEALGSWGAAGYDAEGTRRVLGSRLQDRAAYTPRAIAWGPDDVVLATGAARGITAECAMAFARATGVKLAILGSTALVPGSDAPAQVEIAENLARIRDEGLVAKYYVCDVTDADSVRATCEVVRAELGPITGVIHGAGLNVPKLAEQLSEADALRQVRPKVLGATNLMRALEAHPPKMFAALTSIIGVTGMHGNSWYAFSNETTDQLLRGFQEKTGAATLAVAYGIWSEVGMGARLGAVAQVQKAGTSAIPPLEGSTRFAELMLKDPGCRQVVITARLAPLDTWHTGALEIRPRASRFIERVLRAEPGVDLVVRTDLNMERDPYLQDHTWSGSPLFPAVFGIEAMAQAVAHVTQREDFEGRRFVLEDLTFHRPIIVHPGYGAEIQISALVAERAPGEPLRVQARITTKQLAFKTDCFSAVFVLDAPKTEKPEMPKHGPTEKSDARPEDFYGSRLFHGPAFRRITDLIELASDRVRFMSDFDVGRAERAAGGLPILTLDPFFLDTLLHGMALGDLEGTSLPTRIERIVLDYGKKADVGPGQVFADIEDRGDGEYRGDATAFDSEGRAFVQFQGIWLKTVEHRATAGSAQENAQARDESAVQQALKAAAEALGVVPPVSIGVEPTPGIHALERADRRKKTLPLLTRVAERGSGGHAEIDWAESGKPIVVGGKADISLAHDDDVSLAVAGPAPQGCDLAPVDERRLEDWVSILGNRRRGVLEGLTTDESAGLAGARVWAALEAGRKANNTAQVMRVRARAGDAVLIDLAEDESAPALTAMTFPVRLARGKQKVVAVLVTGAAPMVEASSPAPAQASARPDAPAFATSVGAIAGAEAESYVPRFVLETRPDGTAGSLLLMRFPVLPRDASPLSRTLHFAKYLALTDQCRDFVLRPVRDELARELATGPSALVSRSVDLEVFGPVEVNDVLEGAVRLQGRGGPFEGTFDLVVDWQRIARDGTTERVARTVAKSAWGKLLGRHVDLTQPPKALSDLLDLFATREAAATSGADLSAQRGVQGPVLAVREVQAELDEVGPSGGITAERFARWMDSMRDRFAAEATRERFDPAAPLGELTCVASRIEHLEEALPLEPIRVTMRALSVNRDRARLLFECVRIAEGGQEQRLVEATHDCVWTRLQDRGRVVSPLPPGLVEAIEARATNSEEKIIVPAL